VRSFPFFLGMQSMGTSCLCASKTKDRIQFQTSNLPPYQYIGKPLHHRGICPDTSCGLHNGALQLPGHFLRDRAVKLPNPARIFSGFKGLKAQNLPETDLGIVRDYQGCSVPLRPRGSLGQGCHAQVLCQYGMHGRRHVTGPGNSIDRVSI
jgi:hypothetical protein